MAIVLNKLCVSIAGRRLVDEVSLELAPGARTALVGSSGAGKSLTCAALAGTLPVAATATGMLTINDVELLGVPAARRPRSARVALIQQDPSTALHPLIAVGDQIAAAARAAGSISRHEAVSRARLLLDRVGLAADLVDRVPGRLSGGQRQRAAVALALASEPVLLLADEPTTALDVVARAELLAVLTEVTSTDAAPAPADTRVPGLLLVTHDLPAAALCERIVVLHEGSVIEEGDAHGVLTRPRHPATRAMCAAAREESLAGALAAIESRGAIDDLALRELTAPGLAAALVGDPSGSAHASRPASPDRGPATISPHDAGPHHAGADT